MESHQLLFFFVASGIASLILTGSPPESIKPFRIFFWILGNLLFACAFYIRYQEGHHIILPATVLYLIFNLRMWQKIKNEKNKKNETS